MTKLTNVELSVAARDWDGAAGEVAREALELREENAALRTSRDKLEASTRDAMVAVEKRDEEIERLREENEAGKEVVDNWICEYEMAHAEIDRLNTALAAQQEVVEAHRLTIKAQYLALCNAVDAIDALRPSDKALHDALAVSCQCDALVEEYEKKARSAPAPSASRDSEVPDVE